MKKLFKWLGIAAAAVIILVAVAAVSLALFLPLDRIKDMAAAELTKILRREVKIEKASFNIFTGLKLEKLSIADLERYGKRDFISADAIELHYDLWPLLRRRVVIRKIGLLKPQILIEKQPKGEFNFSDLLAPGKKDEVKKKEEKAGLPFELFVNSFYMKAGKITYRDRAADTVSGLSNFDMSVSGFELAMEKPIGFKASADVLYQGKPVPIALSGRIELELEKEKIKVSPLLLSVAGENASASVMVSNFKGGPDIVLDLSTKKLSVDPLIAVFSGQSAKKSKPADLTETVNSLTASIPRTLSLKASADIRVLIFQNFTVDRIALFAQLKNKKAAIDIKEIGFYKGVLSGALMADLNVSGLAYSAKDLKLSGFDAHSFSNVIIDTFLTRLEDYKDLKDKLYGTMDVGLSFSGRGVDPKAALKNLSGSASIDIRQAELKRTKILASIADLIRSNSLKSDLKLEKLTADASIKNMVVSIRTLAFAHKDLMLNFSGGVDLNSLTWVAGNRLSLKLSPRITTGLSREYDLLRDPSGWLEAVFELTGSLKLPIPRPVLDKPLDNLKKKAEEKVQALIDEEKKKAEEALKQKAAEETERLKKEASEKLRELIKF